MNDCEKTICELYDSCPSNYQINSIAKMLEIDADGIRDILKANGRELPKGAPKSGKKVAIPSEDNAKQIIVNVPEAVKNLVFKRIDDLECQLSELNAKIEKLKQAKIELESEYKVLADYISLPLGAGNLSQNSSSDNKTESPQASA